MPLLAAAPFTAPGTAARMAAAAAVPPPGSSLRQSRGPRSASRGRRVVTEVDSAFQRAYAQIHSMQIMLHAARATSEA